MESASLPPLCSNIHFNPHSVKLSSELGEIRSCSFSAITGDCVEAGAIPTQFFGSAALTPLAAKVFNARAANSTSSLLATVAIRRSAATNAGWVIDL